MRRLLSRTTTSRPLGDSLTSPISIPANIYEKYNMLILSNYGFILYFLGNSQSRVPLLSSFLIFFYRRPLRGRNRMTAFHLLMEFSFLKKFTKPSGRVTRWRRKSGNFRLSHPRNYLRFKGGGGG